MHCVSRPSLRYSKLGRSDAQRAAFTARAASPPAPYEGEDLKNVHLMGPAEDRGPAGAGGEAAGEEGQGGEDE